MEQKNTAVPDNAEKWREIVEKYDNFLFDCDGVLWEAGVVLKNVPESLQLLRDLGKKVFFVTNNSSRSRMQYKEKLAANNIHSEKSEIYCSAYAGVHYIKKHRPDVKKVYVVGHDGIMKECIEHDIQPFGGPDHVDEKMTEKGFYDMKVEEGIGGVVVGWDLGFNFYKLAYAVTCLRENRDCMFIATNRDAGDMIGGKLIPGGGCMVSAVEAAGHTATLTGKPSRFLSDMIVEENGLDRKKTVMVGDRLETDILFGQNGDMDTILLFTGVTDAGILSDALHTGVVPPTYTMTQLESTMSRLLRSNKSNQRSEARQESDVVSAMYSRDTRETLRNKMKPDDAMEVILARRKARKEILRARNSTGDSSSGKTPTIRAVTEDVLSTSSSPSPSLQPPSTQSEANATAAVHDIHDSTLTTKNLNLSLDMDSSSHMRSGSHTHAHARTRSGIGEGDDAVAESVKGKGKEEGGEIDPQLAAERLAQSIVEGISMEVKVKELVPNQDEQKKQSVSVSVSGEGVDVDVDKLLHQDGTGTGTKALAALSRVFGDRRAAARVVSAQVTTADAFSLDDDEDFD